MSRTTRPDRPAPSRRPLRLLAVSAVGGVLVLSGCSVSSTDLSPGNAAEVGDTTITISTVDDAAQSVCTDLDDNADDAAAEAAAQQQPAQSFAGAQVRTTLLEGLVLRSVADQVRGQYGVSASADYAAQEAQAVDFYSDVADQATVVDAVTGGAYFTDIVLSIGRESLGATPEPDTSGDDPTDDGNDGSADQAAFEAGYPLVRDYVDSTGGLEVNPLFGQLSFSDDPLASGSLVFFDESDDELSVAAGDQALAGTQEPLTAGFLDTLSGNQVCG